MRIHFFPVGNHYLPARLWREIHRTDSCCRHFAACCMDRSLGVQGERRIRSCARGLTSCISSFRKQSRAGNQIGRVFLQRCFGKTGAQNAELNWNGDLFFHGDADADDQVGGNFSVRADARSLPALLVARRHVKPELQSSVRRGRKAELPVLGIQSSKKLVSTSGWEGLAILTSAQQVMLLSARSCRRCKDPDKQ